jgi:hypothetical protein
MRILEKKAAAEDRMLMRVLENYRLTEAALLWREVADVESRNSTGKS